MIVYFAVAAGAIGLTSLGDRTRGRHRPPVRLIDFLRRPLVGTWSVTDLVVVCGLVVFSAFRWRVGTDYGLYTDLYQRLDPSDWAGSIARSPQELGFTVLSLALRSVSPGPRPLFVLCAAATVLLSYAALKRASAWLPLSVAIYILYAGYLQPFNTVRQGLAIAILFWANRFLVKRWPVWILFVLLATSFHTTAAFAALAQLLVIRWRPTLMTSIAVIAVLGLGGGLLIHAPPVIEWLSAINPRYGVYLSGDGSGLGTYLIAAVWAILLVGTLIVARGRPTGRLHAYGTLAVLFTIIGTFAPDAGRMADYFTPFFALLVPAAIERHGHRRIIGIGIVLFGAAYFATFLLSFDGLLPYRAALL